jgi:helicase MOV-10
LWLALGVSTVSSLLQISAACIYDLSTATVAVTRAKALLIIVGNPSVLSLDPLWRSFLNYIYQSRGWTGCDISWDPEAPVDPAHRFDQDFRVKGMSDMNDFTRRMEELALEGAAADVNSEDEGANVDRPWRDIE